MTYRVMIILETNEEFCHQGGFDKPGDAYDYISDIMDSHPECGFRVEPEETYGWCTDDEFIDDEEECY